MRKGGEKRKERKEGRRSEQNTFEKRKNVPSARRRATGARTTSAPRPAWPRAWASSSSAAAAFPPSRRRRRCCFLCRRSGRLKGAGKGPGSRRARGRRRRCRWSSRGCSRRRPRLGRRRRHCPPRALCRRARAACGAAASCYCCCASSSSRRGRERSRSRRRRMQRKQQQRRRKQQRQRQRRSRAPRGRRRAPPCTRPAPNPRARRGGCCTTPGRSGRSHCPSGRARRRRGRPRGWSCTSCFFL